MTLLTIPSSCTVPSSSQPSLPTPALPLAAPVASPRSSLACRPRGLASQKSEATEEEKRAREGEGERDIERYTNTHTHAHTRREREVRERGEGAANSGPESQVLP